MVDIELMPNSTLFSEFSSDVWYLPRRYGIAKRIAGPGIPCRINADRTLSVVSAHEQSLRLKVPTAAGLLKQMFQPWKTQVENRSVKIKKAPRTLHNPQTSANGNQFTGLLQMFGALEHFEVMGNVFWLDVFTRMFGEIGSLEEDLQEMLLTEKDPAKASRKLAKYILLLRSAGKELTRKSLDDIASIHEEKNEYFERQFDFDDHFKWLVQQGIILQGSRLLCPECGNFGWYSIDELRRETSCKNCLSDWSLGPLGDLSFTACDLASRCFQKLGLINVAETLFSLSANAQESFLFQPAQNIFEVSVKELVEGNAYTDLDIIALADSNLLIGEVKSGTKGIRQWEYSRTIEIAKAILPREVLLAAPGSAIDEASKTIQSIKDEFKTNKVELSILRLDWTDSLARWRKHKKTAHKLKQRDEDGEIDGI
jgi:hypothetical protein